MIKDGKLTPLESRFCNKAEVPGPLMLGYLARSSISCACSMSLWFCNNQTTLVKKQNCTM